MLTYKNWIMKLFFTIILTTILGITTLLSQTVQRDKVLVEIATGTWCQYCPGAAMGADELVANGHDVAIIENHGGDDYQTTASYARIAYYNTTGYPTAVFDGGSPYVGGSATNSLYSTYLTRYNQKITIPSYFTIDVTGTTSGYSEFNIQITSEMVESYTANDIRLHCVVTESEIEESWQGMDHLNFVNRLMVPSQFGTQLDFSSSSTIVTDLNFTIEPEWVPENCELVVFLQNNTTKEVLNTTKLNLMDFENENDYDAALSGLTNIPDEICMGILEPEFVLKNSGNLDLTSLTINYQVNDGELYSYDWTGSLAFLEKEIIVLPTITFDSQDNNQILIYSENPDGNPDEYTNNDTVSSSMLSAEYTSSDVSLYLRTDDHPEETTWELLNDLGEVVSSGGPYTQSGQVVIETFSLEDDRCYRFSLSDAGGDGLTSPAMCILYYGNNVNILQATGNFGYNIMKDFYSANTVGVDNENYLSGIQVYPNPASDKTIVKINTPAKGLMTLRVFNILGELVYETQSQTGISDEFTTDIIVNEWENGIYFVNASVNGNNFNSKFTVSN